MKLYLKALSKDDGKKIYDMLQEITPNDNGFHNEIHGVSYQEFNLWLERNEGFSRGIGLEGWMVPQTTYWLFYNQTPVGYGRIRHRLNENLKNNSGHIGYAIPISQRGKGYGNELLRLLLKECSKMGIKTVQIGVNISNIRSNRVVQYNGGILSKVTENKNIYHINI
ncbi:GNAT family N-acetyltransferase [Paenibacillus sp. 102]|uniref:GNAT family N-acetyltransferase n=1 Tax=Paenibacillus sp. 102 TaxID=3120823 RepID=UPI0031BA4C23